MRSNISVSAGVIDIPAHFSRLSVLCFQRFKRQKTRLETNFLLVFRMRKTDYGRVRKVLLKILVFAGGILLGPVPTINVRFPIGVRTGS